MKLIISTLVVGVVLFLLGWLTYGALFAAFFKQYYGHIYRSETDMKIWAFAIANFAQAFFMYLIYSKGYQGGAPLNEGLRFGLLIGLFWTIPYMAFTWGGMPVAYKGVLVDGLIGFVMTLIAGILTAMIHGKKDAAAKT